MGTRNTNDEAPAPVRPWLMQARVIDVQHLTRETALLFNTLAKPGYEATTGLFVIPTGSGFLVNIDSDAMSWAQTTWDSYPQDMQACLKWSLQQGYEWLRFEDSGAGDIIAEVPYHEWSWEDAA